MTDGVTILIDGLTAEIRTAVLRNGSPMAFAIHPPPASPRVGDVYVGRVRKAGAGGFFVRLDDGVDGFLPIAATRSHGISVGQQLSVEVRREGVSGKGCRLALSHHLASTQTAPGQVLDGPSPGVEAVRSVVPDDVERIVVEGEEACNDFRNDIARIDPRLVERVERYAAPQPLFEAFGVEDSLVAASDPAVPLHGGGRLIVEETAALVAIDVDGGASTAEQTNARAVTAIADVIARRGLAGVMMVDPAGSNDRRHGFRLAEALPSAFAARWLEIDVKGVTRAGLVELVRHKKRESVTATLGRLRSRAYIAIRAAHGGVPNHPGQAMILRANGDLTELLGRTVFQGEFDHFAMRHGVALHLETDNAMAWGSFEVMGECR